MISTMKIFVKQPSNGETIQLAVREEETVDAVKLKIEHATRIPAEKQSLIFRGEVMRGRASLRFYGVRDSATLHVVKGRLARTVFSDTTNASDACSGACSGADTSSSPVLLHLESLLGLDYTQSTKHTIKARKQTKGSSAKSRCALTHTTNSRAVETAGVSGTDY